ncbi:MAG: tRNA pseudouridine(55) synthase TruB [Treponema sp.]|jgi:tRNA pseudouridine55 synthase|nr:tRNA pseudouridine(55) synthase TruB [Treponema sp.]
MRAETNKNPEAYSGFLLLNKKPGFTSFETLNRIKEAFAPSKVGHTGTLDKFASGLLIALVGRAVKLTSWFTGTEKEYEGTIRLGQETDTLDPEGTVIGEAEPPSPEALAEVLDSFRGNILQAPPAYSAVHIDGERASVLARNGMSPEMRKRPVTIYALELRSYESSLARIYVRCSKGTYIRSLARDIALAAGSRGYLAALTRTATAGFTLADAVEIEGAAIEGAAIEGATLYGAELYRALRPIDTAAFAALGIKQITLDEITAAKIHKGFPLRAILEESRLLQRQIPHLEGETGVGLFDVRGELLAVIEKKPFAGRSPVLESWRYGYVYARAREP